MSSCRATNAKAMAAEIARLRALVMAADTLAEAACNLDDYSQDDPEGPELEASVAAYVEMRRGYEPTDARPEPTATVERVTSEVARGMGTGEPRCVECRHPIGSVAHVDCDAPTLGIVGRSSGYTPTPEPERTPEKDDAIKYEFTPRQIEILALIPDEQIETHLARRRARRSGGAQ